MAIPTASLEESSVTVRNLTDTDDRKNESSGVVVGPGLVVTCFHSMAVNAEGIMRESASVIDRHGKEYKARIARADARHDLCLLQVEGLESPAVSLGDSRSLRIDEPVVAVSKDNLTSDGRVTRHDYAPDGELPLIMSSIRANKGWSGSGLYDKRQQLVGLVAYGAGNGCIPVEWIKRLIQRTDNKIEPVRSPPYTEIEWYFACLGNRDLARQWEAERPDSFFAHNTRLSFQLEGLNTEEQIEIVNKELETGGFPEDELRLSRLQMDKYNDSKDADYLRQALDTYERYMQRTRPSVDLWDRIGQKSLILNDRERAAKAFINAIRTDDAQSNFHWASWRYAFAANILKDLNRENEATEILREGIRSMPADPEIAKEFAENCEMIGFSFLAEEIRSAWNPVKKPGRDYTVD